jgi:hypothetical protein
MRQSHRSNGGLRSTRLWLAGVACGVLTLSGIGLIYSASAEAFPISIQPIYVGNTYVVNTTADPSATGVGACATGGLCSFREAVNQYNLDQGVVSNLLHLHIINRDEITFSLIPVQTIVGPNGDPIYGIGANGPVDFNNPNRVSVEVVGNGEGVTVIDGDGSADLLITNGSVTLSGLTVENGSGASLTPEETAGGGIANGFGNLTVTNSTVVDSAADEGGGIFNLNGTVNITNSTVEGNTVGGVGGGGGIANAGGSLTLSNSTVENNTAFDGGGIFLDGGAVDLNGSTVEDNSAADGGGIYDEVGTATLSTSTVENNTATVVEGAGGGIFNVSGTVNLTDSTVENNTAVAGEEDGNDSLGGGIFTDSRVDLTDSTVESNTASAGGGIFDEEGTVDVLSFSLVEFNAATGAVETDPGVSGDGGGIYVDDTGIAVVVIDVHSSVTGNTAAGDGGGVYDADSLTVHDSSVVSNTAAGDGGGVYDADSLTVSRSTIGDNTASLLGGGVYVSTSGTSTVTNSTIAGNSPDDVYNEP